MVRILHRGAAMLEARGLTKWYGGVLAVSEVNFTVPAGQVLGYLGPNGSGKSTTVGMLAGLIEPTSGAVFFSGADIAEDSIDFRRHVGYVPEEPDLYPFLSGREHLDLVAQLRDMDAGVATRRTTALLDLFGLGHHADAPLSSYSKGMRQKILLSGPRPPPRAGRRPRFGRTSSRDACAGVTRGRVSTARRRVGSGTDRLNARPRHPCAVLSAH